MNEKTTRRKFLSHTLIAGAGVAFVPALGFGKSLDAAPTPSTITAPTTLDLYGQGPFYKENAPVITDDLSAGQVGDPILIYGYVVDAVNANPIPNAEIDIWHANDNGAYDNDGFELRGKVFSDENGYYSFKSIKPGFYLNGPTFRPAHIHFKITPDGESPLITQLYFKDDPYIPTDAAASRATGTFNASDRIIPLVENGEGIFEGCWNIVIDVEDNVNSVSHNLNTGLTYSINQVDSNRLEVYLGVFESGYVELDLVDISGKHISTIVNRNLTVGKHAISEHINQSMKSGVYIARLKINGKPTLPMRFKIN